MHQKSLSINHFLAVFCIAIYLVSCSKRTVESPDDFAYQQEYFKLEIGQTLEYHIDSILFEYDSTGMRFRDTISVEVRDEVRDTNLSASGELEYYIVRSERNADGQYVPVRTFTAGRSSVKAWRTEDNFRIMKMPFPMDRRSEWDGLVWVNPETEVEIRSNRIRPFSNWQFEVDSLDVFGSVGIFNFDSTLHITEADDVNAIEKRYSKVIYALHVGPVYMEQWILDSQYCNQTPAPSDCETIPWEQKGERGYVLKQIITKY